MAKYREYSTSLTKFYTLLLLKEGSKHGYEIIDELGKRFGKKPSPGQIYPLLRDFEKNKLVRQKTTYVGDRKKKVYTLTERGRSTYSRMVSRFENLISIVLEPKLTECAHCGCKVYEGGHRAKVGGKTLTFCCIHCAKSYREDLAKIG